MPAIHGFVLDPAGKVVVSVYSSGAIGRLTPEDVVGLVHTLTSFETFDNLAGLDREPEQVVSLVHGLVRAVVESRDSR